MAANGINAIRTYTPPPEWLLDIAQRHGLYVMVGLPWEQHIAFLDEPGRASSIEQRVREAVCGCAGHPAVLCYAIGNEIPASIVRWHGARRVERFLERLYRAAKAADPQGLVTYVNFPTTEYLRLPFVDFVCFNVYLESREKLEAYLARLQNLAGDRPLVMAEIGLDSRRHGGQVQARTLQWQIESVFAAGCAGLFVFAWTDEWHRGGYAIEDWDFGLTGRDRAPKPALSAVRQAFTQVPFPRDLKWPSVSVIVASYNGSRTIGECLERLSRLEYPCYEVIVVDDGSTDPTSEIARRFDVRLIRTENRGLSAARNAGLDAATGEIVAYIDDDAWPDPHWLSYLAYAFLTTDFAGVGGPNIPPPGDGMVAECVANAPGGPVHVLISDREAEHIPGCNCAFRRDRLLAIGGFDPQFCTAGDDVDVCWRLQQKGWRLGFHPGAMVWHHRRNSLTAYLRQQRGYGRAEALLERKWPEKYNAMGHLTWSGRMYGQGFTRAFARWRIYHGIWGSAPFQALYQPGPGTLASLPLMPEWHLLNTALLLIASMGAFWRPLALACLPLALSVLAPVIYALRSAAQAGFPHASPAARVGRRALTALLHIAQPMVRLHGRLSHGLTPWRLRSLREVALPRRRLFTIWSENWQSPQDWLRCLEALLKQRDAVVRRGGNFDSWDLEILGGPLAAVRTRLAVEEHGAGRQFLRFCSWPRCSILCVTTVFLLLALGAAAGLKQMWLPGAILAGDALLLLFHTLRQAAISKAATIRGLERLAELASARKPPRREPVANALKWLDQAVGE